MLLLLLLMRQIDIEMRELLWLGMVLLLLLWLILILTPCSRDDHAPWTTSTTTDDETAPIAQGRRRALGNEIHLRIVWNFGGSERFGRDVEFSAEKGVFGFKTGDFEFAGFRPVERGLRLFGI